MCNVAFFHGHSDTDGPTYTARMQARIDAPEGREAYERRFATVEPVLGNLRANKRLDRFTLRGPTKVNGQWTLYCLVHNIEKLAHAGYAAWGAPRNAHICAYIRAEPSIYAHI